MKRVAANEAPAVDSGMTFLSYVERAQPPTTKAHCWAEWRLRLHHS
jgi:hypothetical protein